MGIPNHRNQSHLGSDHLPLLNGSVPAEVPSALTAWGRPLHQWLALGDESFPSTGKLVAQDSATPRGWAQGHLVDHHRAARRTRLC